LVKRVAAYLQKFANWIGWGSLGAVIGIAGLFLAIDFKKPDVRAFILGDTNIVDVKSPLNDLEILYNGRDLLKDRLTLHVYRIQMQNTGNTILSNDDFDNNDLWGIRVSSGTIVKISEPRSESAYITKNIGVQIPDQTTVLFTPIIFEPGDSFTLDFFVLVSISSETPSVITVGKIAGIRQIPRDSGKRKPEVDFR
jgi:hypothetical protein